MINYEQILEFNIVKNKLQEYAYTEAAKKKLADLAPMMSELEVKAALRETTEARMILEKIGTPPLTSLEGIKETLQIAEKGGCLTEDQLEKVAAMLTTVRRMKDFLNRSKQLEISLPYYEENLDAIDDVREEIQRVIRNGKVDDYATKILKDLRNDMERCESRMREKADAVLRANKAYMSDQFYTARNGRICVPVKKEYKLKIAGSVIDQSATGSTLFIEPAAVARHGEELAVLKLDEENEVRRILYTLTAMLADAGETFEQNKKTMEKLDFIFAKGQLSVEFNAIEPEITLERRIHIGNGRHPLMDQETCIPLDFQIGGTASELSNGQEPAGIIITGPNTGGKTVAVKTVGLNCLMAQCGLHVTCEKARLCMNSHILCDIGDGQNIEENLSTFSAHIKNALSILKSAGKESLVIMDELGSGTDPTEGMGIAIAILEELKKSGALFLITTHYPEVKNYAEKTSGIINARMAFDRESLKPLYRLEIGEAGESCALYIAKRLGMPGSMLKQACLAAYGREDYGDWGIDETEELLRTGIPKLEKKKIKGPRQPEAEKFRMGDSVMIYPDRKIGIVCQPINEKGVLRVQMQDKKIWINHKRVKLHVAADQLYPEDYDFSIVFDSVATRKARHIMERKYTQDVEIRIE